MDIGYMKDECWMNRRIWKDTWKVDAWVGDDCLEVEWMNIDGDINRCILNG